MKWRREGGDKSVTSVTLFNSLLHQLIRWCIRYGGTITEGKLLSELATTKPPCPVGSTNAHTVLTVAKSVWQLA